MSAFRRSQQTWRLLTITCNYLQRNSVCHPHQNSLPLLSNVNFYSSKPKENESEQNQHNSKPVELDPFGIEEIVGSEEASDKLVQGFYTEGKPPPQTPSSSDGPPKYTPPPPPPPITDATKKRLAVYDGWIKQRNNTSAVPKEEYADTESFRDTTFGKIRVDSDNPALTNREYVLKDNYNNGEYSSRGRGQGRGRSSSRLETAPVNTSQEPITETIKIEGNKLMRASDFIKELRQQPGVYKDKTNEDKDNQHSNSRSGTVIKRVIFPKDVPESSIEDLHQFAVENETPKSRPIVPKVYQLPEYNYITEEDMWNVLRKTVIFQNEFLFAINKPYGVPVHSKARSCRHTIIHYLKQFAELAKVKEVYPVHRLDKQTTGVLLFAKDPKVAAILKDKFATRNITKVYMGVTKLCPQIAEGTIKIPIGEGLIPGTKMYRRVLRPDLRSFGLKLNSKTCVEAVTKYKVLHSMKEASFLEIQPVTGVKHQIRVHLGMGLGCPLIGDHKYSHTDKLAPQRLHPIVLHKIKVRQSKVREVPLHLHCQKISFTLPEEYTKSPEPVYIHAKIPYFMKYTLTHLGFIRR